jgi:hypothetical protein
MVSGLRAPSSSEIAVGGAVRQGWWLVVDEETGPGRVVAGPFPDRAETGWAADALDHDGADEVRVIYGIGRADGGVDRRPSPHDWAWLAHLSAQLDRLPAGWDAGLPEDDPLATLVVEVAAALVEAGLSLHDPTGTDEVGGVCLSPEPLLGGIVVTWRQHDRMSVEQIHGASADGMVQQVMNRALAEMLQIRGFVVDAFGGASGHLVRL